VILDLEVLKKKISTYRTEGGLLRSVSDELLFEILTAWENWTGSRPDFYRGIGVDPRKMASLLGKAKKMKREGHFPAESFKEIKLAELSVPTSGAPGAPCQGVELTWEGGKVIRFPGVGELLEFLRSVEELKKSA
jgi:hypothetical protein